MATYYKCNTNPTNTNWNQADNWSTVSSASATNTGTYPNASGDTAIFDAGSIGVNVAVAQLCGVLDMRNYTNTLTLTNNLTLNYGTATHYLPTGSGGTLAGAGQLIMGAIGMTINPGNHGNTGTPLPGAFGISGASAFTITLGGNLYVAGDFIITGSAAVTHVLNGNIIYVRGNLTHVSNGSISGTTKITMAGTGAWSGGSSSVFVSNNLEISTAGTFSIAGGASVGYKTGNFVYMSGTVSIASNSTLYIQGTCGLNLNPSSVTLGLVSVLGTATITLSNGLKIAGQFQSNTTTTFAGAYTVELAGGASFSSGVTTSTSTQLKLSGGTFYGTGALNLVISVAGNVQFGSGTTALTVGGTNNPAIGYTSGTITMGATGTSSSLTIGGNCQMGTGWNAIAFTNIGSNATATLTLNSDLNISGQFNLASSLTINGAYNVNVSGGFPTSGSGAFVKGSTATIVFKAGTYNNSSLAFNAKLIINPSGTVTLGNGVMQDGGYLQYVAGAGTVVNASGSNYINAYGGTTFDVATIPAVWNLFYISNTGTYTLASDLHANVIQFVAAYTATWTGAYDIYCTNLNSVAAGTGGNIFKIPDGKKLYISLGIDFVANKGTQNTISSNTATVKSYLVWNNAYFTNQFITRTNFTDIDASGSLLPVYTYNSGSSITRCVKVYFLSGYIVGGGGLTITNF